MFNNSSYTMSESHGCGLAKDIYKNKKQKNEKPSSARKTGRLHFYNTVNPLGQFPNARDRGGQINEY